MHACINTYTYIYIRIIYRNIPKHNYIFFYFLRSLTGQLFSVSYSSTAGSWLFVLCACMSLSPLHLRTDHRAVHRSYRPRHRHLTAAAPPCSPSLLLARMYRTQLRMAIPMPTMTIKMTVTVAVSANTDRDYCRHASLRRCVRAYVYVCVHMHVHVPAYFPLRYRCHSCSRALPSCRLCLSFSCYPSLSLYGSFSCSHLEC